MNAQEIESLCSKAHELGDAYERTYRGCAQCTIAAVLEVLGRSDPALFRAASGLASGGGLTCAGSCGGFSGGSMIFGSLFGRRFDHVDDDAENKRRTFDMTKELHDRFMETYGSVVCRDIHRKLFGRTFDLRDPAEKRLFEEAGAHTDICTEVVANAAGWTTGIILRELACKAKPAELP